MKAALGGGFLLNIVIFIVAIVMLLFVGVLAYSKAYRIKDRIIEVVENNDGYTDDAITMINEDLKASGYMTTSKKNCKKVDGFNNLNETSYNYCIYGPFSANNGVYYKVITYVHFDFPLVGGIVNIPVNGETKILGKKYQY